MSQARDHVGRDAPQQVGPAGVQGIFEVGTQRGKPGLLDGLRAVQDHERHQKGPYGGPNLHALPVVISS